jgi:cell division protein FtsB
VRRARLILGSGFFGAIIILIAWFPFSPLFNQHQQLSAAAAQLQRLERENRALAQEAKRLNTPQDIKRIARAQYDLVTAGSNAYQVLPPISSKSSTSDKSSDLKTTTPVTPSGYARTVTVTTSTTSSTQSNKTSAHTSLWGRILHTLEFWR